MVRIRLINIGSYNAAGVPIATKGLSDQRLKRSVFHILKENVLCSIATVDVENRPHINTAYFSCSDALEFYFLSHPGSLHCRNLSMNSLIAMTIFSSSQMWTNPGLGLQLFGTSTEANRNQIVKAKRSYSKRFPAFTGWEATLGRDDCAREYRFYRVLTTRLKLHDEETFGDGVFLVADVKRSYRSRPN